MTAFVAIVTAWIISGTAAVSRNVTTLCEKKNKRKEKYE
jgi:hypothetical protein